MSEKVNEYHALVVAIQDMTRTEHIETLKMRMNTLWESMTQEERDDANHKAEEETRKFEDGDE